MKPKLLTRLLAAAFFVASTAVSAAGLGKLTVLSSLGQPLRAEIDLVSVQKDELSTLSARVASPDAYQQAGIEYNSALPSVKLAIEKRPSGQPYIKITSTQAVNEPFLDLLVELNSASGKLAREYTVLMDPPGVPRGEPVAPVAAPQGKPMPAEPAKAAEQPATKQGA
ncbi:MAG: pilus assembly protein FimV, partial [Burkholderiales bacterium]